MYQRHCHFFIGLGPGAAPVGSLAVYCFSGAWGIFFREKLKAVVVFLVTMRRMGPRGLATLGTRVKPEFRGIFYTGGGSRSHAPAWECSL